MTLLSPTLTLQASSISSGRQPQGSNPAQAHVLAMHYVTEASLSLDMGVPPDRPRWAPDSVQPPPLQENPAPLPAHAACRLLPWRISGVTPFPAPLTACSGLLCAAPGLPGQREMPSHSTDGHAGGTQSTWLAPATPAWGLRLAAMSSPRPSLSATTTCACSEAAHLYSAWAGTHPLQVPCRPGVPANLSCRLYSALLGCLMPAQRGSSIIDNLRLWSQLRSRGAVHCHSTVLRLSRASLGTCLAQERLSGLSVHGDLRREGAAALAGLGRQI